MAMLRSNVATIWQLAVTAFLVDKILYSQQGIHLYPDELKSHHETNCHC